VNDPSTIGGLLHHLASDSESRHRPAVICEDEAMTFAELDALANRLANGILNSGIGKGDRVAVLGRNSATYVALYFALAKAGAIMVPVNFWYREQEVAYTLKQSGARLLIVQERYLRTGLAAVQTLSPAPNCVVYDGTADGIRSLTDISGRSDVEPDAGVLPDDPHIILYTSGTTGFPKGATLSHRAHLLHARALATATDGRRDDVGAVIYPLFHTGGPDCIVLPHFLNGASIVVLDGGDPDAILDAAERHGLTSIFCVPTVWRWIIKQQAERRADISSIRRCLGSSDTFPPALLDAILKTFNADVYVTYGLTEAGCILTVCHLTKDDHSRIGSVGCPMPGVELRVVDADGDPVLLNDVGEIIARSPGMMSHYWNMPDRTKEALREGWLYSGDLGRMDEEGYIYLAGRSKDIIISAGENIYPLEVERVIKENLMVRDAAVVGVPDPEWSESVLAVVVPSEGATITESDIIAFVSDRVAGYKRPRYVEIVDELPMTTATNKVQKAKLRERYANIREDRARGLA